MSQAAFNLLWAVLEGMCTACAASTAGSADWLPSDVCQLPIFPQICPPTDKCQSGLSAPSYRKQRPFCGTCSNSPRCCHVVCQLCMLHRVTIVANFAHIGQTVIIRQKKNCQLLRHRSAHTIHDSLDHVETVHKHQGCSTESL